MTTDSSVTTAYEGPPPKPIYYEGAILAGFPADDTELSVLRNIQAVGYGR